MPKQGESRKPRWTVYYWVSGYGRNGKPVSGYKHMIVEGNSEQEAIDRVVGSHYKDVIVTIDYAVKGQEDRRSSI